MTWPIHGRTWSYLDEDGDLCHETTQKQCVDWDQNSSECKILSTELRLIEIGIRSPLFKKFIMCPTFDDVPIAEQNNLIGISDCR